MNKNNNITLTQKAFNNFLNYLKDIKSLYYEDLINFSNKGYTFKGEFDEQGNINIAVLKNNMVIKLIYFSYNRELEASKIQSILFNPTCRVEE